MSFILNAIRKSEQQRQASQTETLENKILEKQTYVQKKTSGWLIVLVIVNVFFLSYFIWLFTSEEDAESANKSEIVIATEEPEEKIKAKVNIPLPPVIKTTTQQRQISIAEQLKSKQPGKPQAVKKTVPQKIPPLPEQKKKSFNKPKPIAIPKLATAPMDIAEDIKMPPKNELPFLSELDYPFRRNVPEIDINVFVYSENKDKRFIMIDMKKHRAGEKISAAMTLKEIRINSIVVEYKNKRFQIKR